MGKEFLKFAAASLSISAVLLFLIWVVSNQVKKDERKRYQKPDTTITIHNGKPDTVITKKSAPGWLK